LIWEEDALAASSANTSQSFRFKEAESQQVYSWSLAALLFAAVHRFPEPTGLLCRRRSNRLAAGWQSKGEAIHCGSNFLEMALWGCSWAGYAGTHGDGLR